jgi:hypothetical protein
MRRVTQQLRRCAVLPPSTQESEQNELEHETYHYLGWSHSRIERTVERLLSSDRPGDLSTGAAREIIAAFGLTGPPDTFWATPLGHRCVDNGMRPRTSV